MDNNSDNDDSNNNATVSKDGFLAILAALHNGLNLRSTNVVACDQISVRDASSSSEHLCRALRRACKSLCIHTAAHKVLITALQQEATSKQECAAANRCA